jgi:hypothetical protein
MTRFAVIRRRGPAWDATRSMREQRGWDEHAAFMDALADAKVVVLAGALGEEERFLALVDADDEAAIRARLDRDPWTPMDMVRIETIQRWTLLLGELVL